jgi:cysteinyl-tRNA synthetase
MAKSTGNIARVGELLGGGISARALRYALISVHYRAANNYSDESLAAAGAAVDRLDALVGALSAYREDGAVDATLDELLEAADRAFGEALDDDLNVSEALAVVFDLVRELNRRIDARALSTADAARALATLRSFDEVLGILPDAADELADDALRLLDERAAARANRDWAASDRLREELAAIGIAVEDTRDGQRWRRQLEPTRG